MFDHNMSKSNLIIVQTNILNFHLQFISGLSVKSVISTFIIYWYVLSVCRHVYATLE